MKEHNVIGTMQLLAACQQAPRLRKLVVRSSTAAYGASFRDPAVFTEDTEPREVPRGGFARDILDIEGYVRGFRRRRPDVDRDRAALRAVHRPAADTTLTRYFALPVVPTVLGRDPRLQFIHIDDALEVLHRSVVERPPRHVQRGRRRACSRCPRRSAGPAGSPCRCSSRACPRSRRSRKRSARRVRPRPARPVRARPGGRHHAADRGVRLHAALHRRGVRRLHPRRTPAVPSLGRDQLAAAERTIRDGIRQVARGPYGETP